MANAFGWGETHNDLLSAEAAVTVNELEEVPEDSHEAGAWDAADIKLTRRGKIQPTLGCPAGRFVKAGCDISNDDSCMLSLFLETFSDRLKTYREDLTLEGLYRMLPSIHSPRVSPLASLCVRPKSGSSTGACPVAPSTPGANSYGGTTRRAFRRRSPAGLSGAS